MVHRPCNFLLYNGHSKTWILISEVPSKVGIQASSPAKASLVFTFPFLEGQDGIQDELGCLRANS